MKYFTYQAAIGAVVLVSLVLAYFIFTYTIGRGLRGPKPYKFHVIFKDISGFWEGIDVRLSGVVIGSAVMAEVTSDNKAKVLMSVRGDVKLSKRSEFALVMEGGLVGAERKINIHPPPDFNQATAVQEDLIKPGDMIETGRREATIDDLILKTNATMAHIDTILKDVQTFINENPINREILKLAENVNSTLIGINKFAYSLDKSVSGSAQEVNKTLQQFRQIAMNVEKATDEIKRVVTDPKLQEDLYSIMDNLDKTMVNLQKISEDVEELTGDEKLKQDIRDTMAEGKETLKEMRSTFKGIEEAFTRAQEPITQATKFTEELKKVELKSEIGARYLVSQDKDNKILLVDIDSYFKKDKNFLRVGFAGVGEDNLFNLMAGRELYSDLDVSAGLYRSKIGTEMDWSVRNLLFSFNLYDPDEPKMNTYLRYSFLKDVNLLLGIEEIGRDNDYAAGLSIKF